MSRNNISVSEILFSFLSWYNFLVKRKTKNEIKQEDYYKVETYFGKFSRSFTLPENADVENIEAKSDNGVLEVVIPKLKDDITKKSIEIK